MHKELANITSMIEAAAAVSSEVFRCHQTMLNSLQAEAKQLPTNGHSVLVDPLDVLKRMQDVKLMVDRIVAAMISIPWPHGAQYQRFIDLRKQEQGVKHP